MDEYFDEDFADVRGGAIAYGQAAADGYFYDPFMVAQNNVDSNAIMAQSGAPVPQATLVANTSMPNQGTSQSKAAKRERDKAYREREKKRKIEMEDNLKKCTQENKALKDEVRALKDEVKASKAENTRQNQAFQSQEKAMDKLKHDFNQLKRENNKQMVLVQTLSRVLAGSVPSPRDEEIQKLKNEIDLLGQGMGVDSPCLELMKENAKLKYELEREKQEKRALKVQLDAVCEKIIAENPSPYSQVHGLI